MHILDRRDRFAARRIDRQFYGNPGAGVAFACNRNRAAMQFGQAEYQRKAKASTFVFAVVFAVGLIEGRAEFGQVLLGNADALVADFDFH